VPAETERIWVFMGRRGKTTTATLMEEMVSKPKIRDLLENVHRQSPLFGSVPTFSPVGMFV